jgi:hypothetical protein
MRRARLSEIFVMKRSYLPGLETFTHFGFMNPKDGMKRVVSMKRYNTPRPLSNPNKLFQAKVFDSIRALYSHLESVREVCVLFDILV